MRPDLCLQDAGRRYGLRGPWVLRGVNLTVAPGRLVRIEGANGSGKSTLLRLLAGIDAPSEGRVTGRPRTAYVPERFPPALPFTAAGYLTHLGTVHGLPRATAARAAGEWLERLGAAAYAETPMARLSKGSSQKGAGLERAVAERTAAGGSVVFVDHDPRRLAGLPDATYAVRDAGVVRQEPSQAPEASGPHVLVEVQGPPDSRLPEDVRRTVTSAQETGPGRYRLRVPAPHSDVLLRTLLTARPPWHVVSVTPRTTAPGRHG
ncbi:ABC transporter ATP-binding protein [Streptomyces luteogriseus]|uniref:ABC transporter ATP-binding protein n=1 Tax=Streptomyces luteogriseus TaxID=68233 RepID=UPI00371DD24B